MLLIGSRALKYHYPDLARQPKDYDVVGTYQELRDYVHQNYSDIKSCLPTSSGKYMIRFRTGPAVEFEHTQSMTDSRHYLLTLEKRGAPFITFPERNLTVNVAFPFALLALKQSHLSLPLKQWEKHILDYNFLKSKLENQQMPSFFDTIYKSRLMEAQARMPSVKVNLCMSNEEFFEQSEPSVKRYFVHDDVHKVMAFYDTPMFNRIKRDPNQASCDRKLFEALSLEDQIKTVQEEAWVIALERKIIPAIMSNETYDADEALKYSLRRICTSLTSGFFREFAQEHYLDILNSGIDYVAKFNDARQKGLIKEKT